jgi:hypothetical protein
MATRIRIERAIDTPARLQFFVTRIIGTEELPDVEILTLPAYPSTDGILNLNGLQSLVQEYGLHIGSTPRKIDGSGAGIAVLHQVIVDAEAREGFPQLTELSRVYAEEIFCTQPVPVMNSPLTGSTLMQMVTAAGGSAAFMATGLNVDLKYISLYFLLIGGTRIVLGAADGISTALKMGLQHILLDWMGVPPTVASARKRKVASVRTGQKSDSDITRTRK